MYISEAKLFFFFLKDNNGDFWSLEDFQATAKDNAAMHIALGAIICTGTFQGNSLERNGQFRNFYYYVFFIHNQRDALSITSSLFEDDITAIVYSTPCLGNREIAPDPRCNCQYFTFRFNWRGVTAATTDLCYVFTLCLYILRQIFSNIRSLRASRIRWHTITISQVESDFLLIRLHSDWVSLTVNIWSRYCSIFVYCILHDIYVALSLSATIWVL